MKLSLTFFCALALFFAADSFAAETVFKAGAVKRDITPKQPVPMWGYGARHSLLSGGRSIRWRRRSSSFRNVLRSRCAKNDADSSHAATSTIP